jgi:phospholipase A-2-activating protein
VKAHDDIIREIAFVPGVGYLTCSNDCSIKVWSHSLEILITMRGHDGFVFTCKPLLYKCLQYYVSGADDNKVKLWDEDGNEVQSLGI